MFSKADVPSCGDGPTLHQQLKLWKITVSKPVSV